METLKTPSVHRGKQPEFPMGEITLGSTIRKKSNFKKCFFFKVGLSCCHHIAESFERTVTGSLPKGLRQKPEYQKKILNSRSKNRYYI